MDILLWSIIGVLFVLTYVGMVVPLIPDVPFLLGGFLLYQFCLAKEGLGTGFWITAVMMIGLMIVIEYVATGFAVKKSGGSTLSILVAMIGLLVFPIFLGPLGFIIGPFLAVFVFELTKRGTLREALKISLGTLTGLLGSIFVKLFIMTSLLIWFFILTWILTW